jgi:signal transduction histidine kinase
VHAAIDHVPCRWQRAAVARDELSFQIFDELPAFATLVEGPDLRVTMINRLVREQPGGESILGRSAHEIYPGDNPIVSTLERVFSTGVGETLDATPPFFPDGSHADRYFTRHFAPLRNETGNIDRVLVLIYEVTEQVRARHAQEETAQRRQAELVRLFALLEETPMLISVLEGPELRVVMTNRLSRELLGSRDFRGVAFGNLVPDGNETLAAAHRVLETGVPESFQVSSQLEGFVGRSFCTTIVPIRDASGHTTRVMVASLEITEHLRAREALESQARDLEVARRQAVEASRAKDEFLAMLGHELRNPLSPMATTLETMRLRGMASPELDLLERQVHHLTRLVDDLLDVSRIARGMVELKRTDLDLRTVVTRALEMTDPLIKQRLHRVITRLSPVVVHGDPDRLAQVAANLITNAAKYSNIGSQISIDTQRSGGTAKLAVTDEGVGIAPDMIGKVFDAFVQEPQMLARSHGGLGLGLSIVKSLVEAHGGTASAHSDGPRKGSTFVVELPAVDTQSDGTDTRDVKASHPPSTAPLRILVVDDNYDAALALQCALEELGHVVAVAHDGPTALAEAATFAPQVGLLDIGLPVMDGYELAVAMRAVRPVRLIAISGYGRDHDRKRSESAGFASHLVKPVYLDDLIPLLHGVHDRPSPP